jgi:predicted O-linked N-acetylglucosamine transferase (SPINDLY family)
VTTPQSLELAIRHLQSGRLAEAEAIFRKILVKEPRNSEALHLLGIILGEGGQLESAAQLMRQAIAIRPRVAAYHCNLGETYRKQKKFDEAIASLRHSIQLDPSLMDAHNNLGIALGEAGRFAETIDPFTRAVALQPNNPEIRFSLGNAFSELGRYDDAIAAYHRAIELNPAYVQAYVNLGSTLQKAGRVKEAIAALSRAIELSPDFADAHNNLGVCLESGNHHEEAIAAYRAAIRLKPTYAHAYSNLGSALKEAGRLDDAIAACNAAIQLDPNFADPYGNLAVALQEKGQLDEALAACTRAIALDPKLVEPHNTLGNIYKDMGQLQPAIDSYQRTLDLQPDYAAVHSNLVYTLHFLHDCDPATLLERHVHWAAMHAEPLKHLIRFHANDRDPNRRLRIGYVSPDFRAHPVGRFLVPLLAHHDPANFEIYCYASVAFPDLVTPILRSSADVWRDIRNFSDEQAAELIRDDRVDILVDLTMHMACSRMLLFARKPAPIQITYLAYCSTTGLDTIDYRITDPYLDPPGSSDARYTERSVHLPQTYWCYQPPVDGLDLQPPPSDFGELSRAESAGFVTFGCLNNFCKVSPPTFDTWTKLLAAVPNSRLLLHARQGAHRQRLRDELHAAGVGPDRLGFSEMLSLPQYMRQYNQIDIALDPFPYVGGTTTCDALWMGVPVVTLRGSTAISRGGVSILSNIGLHELIADTPEQYIRIAADLANDLPRLSHLRSTLRDRMLHSPLMDAPQFARDMETIYRQVWQRWCESGPARS